MKEEVLETLDFDHFTAKQLASEVRKSGLYPADKIFERMEEFIEKKNSEFEKLKVEKDQLRTDMRTVKIRLNVSRHCSSSSYINPWTKYVDGDVKSRYDNI